MLWLLNTILLLIFAGLSVGIGSSLLASSFYQIKTLQRQSDEASWVWTGAILLVVALGFAFAAGRASC